MGRFPRVDVGVDNAEDDIDSTAAATVTHLPSRLTSRWRVVWFSVVATFVLVCFMSLFLSPLFISRYVLRVFNSLRVIELALVRAPPYVFRLIWKL